MAVKIDCEQSLFLENPWERMQACEHECEHDCECDEGAAMQRAASSMGFARRVKRETVLVSYNDLDATLTVNINDTSALLNTTLRCLIVYTNLLKLYPVRYDECFDRLQLKPRK